MELSWRGRAAARQRRHEAAFRVDPLARRQRRPNRRQATVLLIALVIVGVGAALASWLLKPGRAQAFDLFSGTIYINDSRAPVAVDLVSGKSTVRLRQAYELVGAHNPGNLAVYPLANGTLLLNPTTGEFNMVDDTGFVIKLTGGVPLPRSGKPTPSVAVASGSLAYILREVADKTEVYLVDSSTVSQSASPLSTVDPRAYRLVTGHIASVDTDAVAANGGLWLLVGTAQQTPRLYHLTLPGAGGDGATLFPAVNQADTAAQALGVVNGPDGSSDRDVVAIATADAIRLVQPTGTTRTVGFSRIDGLGRVLPATNQQGTANFLYTDAKGWSLLSTPADGLGSVGKYALMGIPAGADLAPPAVSLGDLWTVDRTSGVIYRIDDRGHATAMATYPLAVRRGEVVETNHFADTYLVARGPRVIVDSPGHVYALTFFTNNLSLPPQQVNKSAAVNVSAGGGVEAIARGHTVGPSPTSGSHTSSSPPPSSQPTHQPTAPPPPVQPVSNLDCTDTTQLPHIPVINRQVVGSRSLHLEWSYPRLDAQDCAPTTWEVNLEVVSPGAPSVPGQYVVNNQDHIDIAGLFPNTKYRYTLTGLIKGRGAPTAAQNFTTGPEGPAAPNSVTAVAAADGSWTVTWQACAAADTGCVPATSWNVTAASCDNHGLSGSLSPVTRVGDPTLHRFSVSFPGGGALLGRSLEFRVQGRGEQGTIGALSTVTSCVQSWQAPLATGVTVVASRPDVTAVGGTSSTTVTVNLGANAQTAIGGLGGTVRFQLTGPEGTVVNTPVTYDGTSSILSSTFTGVHPGETYSATAFLAPPGHPAQEVQLDTVLVSTRAAWPGALATLASCAPDTGPVSLNCTLTVTFTGLSSAQVRGEVFDLTDQSRLQCDQLSVPLTDTSFDPATASVTLSVSLLQFSGTCTVSTQLVESASDSVPTVFGGTVSPTLTTPVTLAAPSTLDAHKADFAVAWTGPPGSHVMVSYTGTLSDADVASLTQNWQEQILAPDGSVCASDTRQVTQAGISFDPSGACVANQGGSTGWQVQLSYDDIGTTTTHTFVETLVGGPSGYEPCTVTAADFSGSWSGTAASPAVQVTFSGADADISGCTGWAYALQAPDGTSCGTGPAGQGPTDATPVAFADTCATTPGDGWTITVAYKLLDGTLDSLDVAVTGPVPP